MGIPVGSQPGPVASLPTGRHRTRRALTKQATRDSIVAAASSLFDEVGYTAARTSEIARRASVAPATLFRYFDTKADLAVFHVWTALLDFVDRVTDRPPSETPYAAVMAAVDGTGVAEALDSAAARRERARLARHAEIAAHLCWLAQGPKERLAADFEARLGGQRGPALARALAAAVVDAALDAVQAEDDRDEDPAWLARAFWELRPLFVAVRAPS